MRDNPKCLGRVGLWVAGGLVRLVEEGEELVAEEVLGGEVLL